MSAPDVQPAAGFSVFLSYASEDRVAVGELAAALRAAGIDVWIDAEALRGGDLWDEQIRQQIKTCTFFVAVVSAATQAREEGYFRREWRLAVERSHDMAEDRPFLVPVYLISLAPGHARVPKKFLEVQWIDPRGETGRAELVRRLLELHRRRSGPLPPPADEAATLARHPRPWPWLLLAGLALLLGGAATSWWLGRPPAVPVVTVDTLPLDPQVIAVLPFANLDGDAKDDYLCDGLSEEVLGALSLDPLLHVVARTSSFAFKGKAVPVRDIARTLGSGRLLEGSVRREGSMLRIAVQLVDGATGFQLWRRDYPVAMSDIFELQALVANDVARQLNPTATAAKPARPLTRNLQAYDAYLAGRSEQARPLLQVNIEAAAAHFRQAVAADPAFASAWARLGYTLVQLYINGSNDSDAVLQEAHAAIQTALRLEPNLPEAHTAFAFYHVRGYLDTDLAIRECELARRIAPNDPDNLLLLAACLLNLGEKDRAVATIRQATLLDPRNADTANLSAIILDVASLYPEALAERDRCSRLGHSVANFVDRALVLRNWKGDLKLALRELEQAESTLQDDDYLAYYWRTRAAFLRGLGRPDEAARAIARIGPELIPAQYYYHSKSLQLAAIAEDQGDTAAAQRYYAAALPAALRYRESNPKVIRAYTSLALIQAGLGREGEARATIAAGLALVPPEANPYTASRTGLRVLAQIEARFGQADAALAIVRREIAAGFWKRHDLLLDPDWTFLRRDPRFRELAASAPL